MIPRTLYFVWLSEGPGDRPSDFHRACREQTTGLHPAWDVREWAEPSLLGAAALEPFRPQIRRAWDLFAGHPTARSDLFRLCALYVHGGVYCDFDVWAVRPFDSLLDTDLLLACNSFAPFVVGEHVIGAEPHSPKVAAVIRHFCTGPRGVGGKFSPQLARFVYEFGWEAQLPDVFSPHPRDAAGDDLYRVTPITSAIHCWSPLGYDVGRLHEATDNALPAPAPEDLKHLEICVP